MKTDFDDAWDNVINIEVSAVKKGEQEAEFDAQAKRREGSEIGFVRGFEVGLELGYIREVILANEASSANARKRKTKILNKIGSFPTTNSDSFDFESEMEEIRALYKSCNIPEGPLLRKKPQLLQDW